LGHSVIRVAPQPLYLGSDGYDPKADAVGALARQTDCRIFHYGFIRNKVQFFEKERFLQKAYFNSFDARLEAAEKHAGNWMEMPGVCGWENSLPEFNGRHPTIIHTWLARHGFVL
jgi:hypothetical protein